MGYSDARNALSEYRKDRKKSVMNESAVDWFMSAFGNIAAMLKTFTSDSENSAVAGKYMKGTSEERVPLHMKLDYVCGLRREARKQFVSENDDIYTDVTPFRHSAFSVIGADMFDKALDDTLSKGAES